MGYKSPDVFNFYVQGPTLNPVDGTTYYYGGRQTAAVSTTANRSALTVPYPCSIRKAVFRILSLTAAGTAEDWSLYIRVNDTTDYLVATVSTTDTLRIFSNYLLNIPLAQGDFIEVKMVCPTWVTNPEGCYLWGNVFAEQG